LILVYRFPNHLDGYMAVLTPPQASATLRIAGPHPGAGVRANAIANGANEQVIDRVLHSADGDHFGSCVDALREPETIDVAGRSLNGRSLLLKRGDGYIGAVSGLESPFRRVRAALRSDWLFARPLARKEVLDGMHARGHHAIDIWDLITATDNLGWGVV